MERAQKTAEAEILKRFKEYPVRTVDDLWKLEQLIQRWRRDVNARFYFQYETIEARLIEWIQSGWIGLDDVKAFSESRYERIGSEMKKQGRR